MTSRGVLGPYYNDEEQGSIHNQGGPLPTTQEDPGVTSRTVVGIEALSGSLTG